MDRNVFKYQDGGRDVYADPLVVYRSFVGALGGDPEPYLAAARNESREPADFMSRLEAEGKLAEASRVAFGLPAFDPGTGEGATEAFCLDTLYSFLEWLEGNAGRAGSPAT
jgi:hypothetical protein